MGSKRERGRAASKVRILAMWNKGKVALYKVYICQMANRFRLAWASLPNCGLGLSIEMSKKLGGKEEKKIYSLIQHYSILNTLERKGFTANTFVQPEYLFSSTTQTCESGILHLRNCLSS